MVGEFVGPMMFIAMWASISFAAIVAVACAAGFVIALADAVDADDGDGL